MALFCGEPAQRERQGLIQFSATFAQSCSDLNRFSIAVALKVLLHPVNEDDFKVQEVDEHDR